MIRACAALLLVLLLAGAVFAEPTTRIGTVQLTGPISLVELSLEDGARARILGELVRGETRTLFVPLTSAGAFPEAPRIDYPMPLDPATPAGSARFLGWRPATEALDPLPPGLRARARPALGDPTPAVPRASVFVLLVAALLVVFLRARVLLALAVAFGACVALFVLVRAPGAGSERRVTLIDGALDATWWRRVDAAWHEIEVLDAHGAFELATDPPAARVSWEVRLEPDAPWRARAPGTRLFVTRAQDTLAGRFTRERNGVVDLDPVWTREAGEWSRLEPWRAGAPLSVRRGPESPPGWLAQGLPQGVSMLVARDAVLPSTWLRVAGLP